MIFTSDKVRRLWLPSLVILLVILILSWLVSSLFYPANIQGNSLEPTTQSTPTASPIVTIPIAQAATATMVTVIANTPTLASNSTVNCTYTTTYWRINPEAWLIENVVIGNNSFTKAEAIEILETAAQDEKTALLQQFFAALLNTLKGADARDIEPILLNASDWINGHSTGMAISATDQQQALLFTQTLFEYNNGGLGPGHCSDEPVTPTPTPTSTPTATLTPTVTPIRTLRTPTDIPTQRKPTKPAPTEKPTDQPQPTDIPEPQPTKTPLPMPTQAPTEPPPTEPPPPPTAEPATPSP